MKANANPAYVYLVNNERNESYASIKRHWI